MIIHIEIEERGERREERVRERERELTCAARWVWCC